MISTLLRGMYRKHISSDRDYRIGGGRSLEKPLQISLRITNACNHRCAVCGQYGVHGYLKDQNNKYFFKTLPVESYKELVDQVADYKPLFYITGGEPFLYPGFMDLMEYIKTKGCVLSVVTNGVFLEKQAEPIVRNGWDVLMVSFDGPREIHDQCRNYPGAYDTAVNGLKKVCQIRKEMKTSKPFILTATTISKVNAPFLEETFNLGTELKPDLMVVFLSWFTSDAIGGKQAELLEERMNIQPFTWKSYVTSFNRDEAELFQRSITEIRRKKWPFEYMVIPDLKNDDIASYYLETSKMFGYDKCVAPFFMVDVMPNGDVTTCRDFIDIKVGNITEKPLLEIWNDEPFFKFRELLIECGGLLPQCSRCCGLMGF